MNRSTRIATALCFIFPAAAFIVIAMRLGGSHRWTVATTLCILGTLALAIALRHHARARALLTDGKEHLADSVKRHSRLLGLAGAVVLCGYLALVLFPADDVDFMKATPAELEATVNGDFDMLPVYIQGLDDATTEIEQNKALFQGDPSKYTPEQRDRVLQLWSRYLAYSMQLEQVRHVHRYFFQINYLQHPDLNVRSFLIAYSGFVACFVDTLRLTDIVGNNDFIKTLLNEAHDPYDIPRNAYLALGKAATDPKNLIRLHAGRAHLQFLKTTGLLSATPLAAVASPAEVGYREALKRLGNQPELFTQTPRDQFEKHVLTAWLPLQKGVAEGMSLVRTTHRANFVTVPDLTSAMPDVQPGDILLERRNWYLTNIGIPGFWPHTALYVGSLKEMDEYFKEQMAAGNSVSEFVRNVYPALYSNLTQRTAEGYELRVLEAIGPGVVPTAFENSGRADYLAILRPRLDKQDKLKALFKAFSYYKRPYDYNFDFVTDNALVCSELVYKAYRPGQGKKGLSFQLVETAGRMLLPPNHIIRKFDTEFGTPQAELDFVLFLDGSESDKKAFRREADSLRTSYTRPKWDVAQE